VVRGRPDVKVAGRWTYLYRAVDQQGQVIDVLVSTRRDAAAAREFFDCALRVGPPPVEVTTDRPPVYPRIVEELDPAARHLTEQYANNVVEADRGRLNHGCGRCARAHRRGAQPKLSLNRSRPRILGFEGSAYGRLQLVMPRISPGRQPPRPTAGQLWPGIP
jgi:hypothetical protein